MFKKILIILMTVLVLVAIVSYVPKKEHIVVGDTVFIVSIANTPMLREKGLSYTKSLPENHGMLFVFEKPDNYGFWMKDMNYPLDLIWIDENKRITEITENVYPESYPTVFYSNEAVRYVLEIPAGSAKRFSLKVGETAQTR